MIKLSPSHEFIPLLIILDIGHTIVEKKHLPKDIQKEQIINSLTDACIEGGLLNEDLALQFKHELRAI